MRAEAVQSSTPAQIGRSLRLWRMLRRVKQGHAAELLGVSQATVSRWETGQLAPAGRDRDKLCDLLRARLDTAADRELVRLVEDSSRAIHLICDLTHRLLAMSSVRELECRISRRELLGTSMWCYASAEIIAAEADLARHGWQEPGPPAIEFYTGANTSLDVPIREGLCRWVRFRLSDGSHARLVETLSPVSVSVRPG